MILSSTCKVIGGGSGRSQGQYSENIHDDSALLDCVTGKNLITGRLENKVRYIVSFLISMRDSGPEAVAPAAIEIPI